MSKCIKGYTHIFEVFLFNCFHSFKLFYHFEF